jgi:hypothetical protein
MQNLTAETIVTEWSSTPQGGTLVENTKVTMY